MDQWVRSLRGDKTRPSVDYPIAVSHESERRPGGGLVSSSTVFLAGAECPFSCVFCDLWRQTLDESTRQGSIPRQLQHALTAVDQRSLIKLYNASNFFDPIAVPIDDETAILDLVAGFARVTVESHPRFVGARCFSFAQRLDGTLEVAMGLETACSDALARLNKKMTLDDFDAAAAALREHEIAIRAFVLLGCPFVAAEEQFEWVCRSVEYAVARGAGVVTVIPVRGGNGTLETLEAAGEWRPVNLEQVEAVGEWAARVSTMDTVVQMDLWDLDRLGRCRACIERRRARLDRLNRGDSRRVSIACSVCGSGVSRTFASAGRTP